VNALTATVCTGNSSAHPSAKLAPIWKLPAGIKAISGGDGAGGSVPESTAVAMHDTRSIKPRSTGNLFVMGRDLLVRRAE
jgi:hypothetical protein